jgi:hypothetical protein
MMTMIRRPAGRLAVVHSQIVILVRAAPKMRSCVPVNGTEPRISADRRAPLAVLIEPTGVVNTGDAGGPQTAEVRDL